MNPEDFPVCVIAGVHVRRVPELPEADKYGNRCTMCAASPTAQSLDREFCSALYQAGQKMDLDCAADADTGTAYIYLPEDKFQDYVVELVRRRVSS